MSIDLNKIGYTPQVKRQRDIVGTPADVSAEAQAAGIGASADASIFGTLAKVGANVGSSIESESRRRQRNRAVLQRQEDAVQKAITDSEEQFVRNRWTNLTSAEKDILQTAITEDKTNFANWGKGGENDFLSRYELKLNNFFDDETLLAILTKDEHTALFDELLDEKNSLINTQKQSIPLKAGAAVIEINQDNVLTTVDDAIVNINTDLPTNILIGSDNVKTRAAAVLEIINQSDILSNDKILEITGKDNKTLEKNIQNANLNFVVSTRPDEAITFLSQSLSAKEQGDKQKDLFPEFSSKELFTFLKNAQGNLNTIQSLTNDEYTNEIIKVMGVDEITTQENLAERQALKSKIEASYKNNELNAEAYETLIDKLDLNNTNNEDMATLLVDILNYDPYNDKNKKLLAGLTTRIHKFEGVDLEILKEQFKKQIDGSAETENLRLLTSQINAETKFITDPITGDQSSLLIQEIFPGKKFDSLEVPQQDVKNFRTLAIRLVTSYLNENPTDYQGALNLYTRAKSSELKLKANEIYKIIFQGQIDDPDTLYINEGYERFSSEGFVTRWEDLDRATKTLSKEEIKKGTIFFSKLANEQK